MHTLLNNMHITEWGVPFIGPYESAHTLNHSQDNLSSTCTVSQTESFVMGAESLPIPWRWTHISHSGGEEVDQVLVSEAHSTSAIDIVTDSYSTSLCNGASCERTNLPVERIIQDILIRLRYTVQYYRKYVQHNCVQD